MRVTVNASLPQLDASFPRPERKRLPIDFGALRRTRQANPVWTMNRPGHWGRGKTLLYYGALAGSWGGAVVAALTLATFSTFLSLTSYVILVGVLQTFLGYGALRAFDFLSQRRWVLEDLWVTPLTPDEIAYGSLRSGIWFSFLLMLPLNFADVIPLAFRFKADILIYAGFVLAFRFLLQCTVVEVSARTLSRMQPAQVPLLVESITRVFLIMLTHWAIFFVAALLVAFGGGLGDYWGPLAWVGRGLSFVMLGGYSYFIGRAAIENAYRVTAENYRKAIAEEKSSG